MIEILQLELVLLNADWFKPVTCRHGILLDQLNGAPAWNQGALAFQKFGEQSMAAGLFCEISYFLANFDLGNQKAKQVAI